LVSEDQGISWSDISFINPHIDPGALPISAMTSLDSTLIVGSPGGGLHKTTDYGKSWYECNNGVHGNAWGVISLVTVNRKIYAGTHEGVLCTSDLGETWTELNNGIPKNDLGPLNVNGIIGLGDTLFAGVFGSDNGGVFRSTNGGTSWSPLLTSIEFNGHYYGFDVNSIDVVGNSIILSTNGFGVYSSSDFGRHWLPTSISSLIQSFRNGSNFSLAVGGRVYVNQGQGDDWNDVTRNLAESGPHYFNCAEIVGKMIFVGTNRHGLWKISADRITGVLGPTRTSLGYDFQINQNYPNPFNPTTTIRFELPADNFVTLKVFDILGKEVATLINEQRPAGFCDVKFDASQLSGGIYFYQIQAGAFRDTKKMILIK
jgi:photosystem II stability/assembly factor-like uncharacterized protein